MRWTIIVPALLHAPLLPALEGPDLLLLPAPREIEVEAGRFRAVTCTLSFPKGEPAGGEAADALREAGFQFLGAGLEPFLQGTAVLLVFWAVLIWMYRRKIFVKI